MINVWETPAGDGARPRVTLDPEKIYAVMINEVAPADGDDDFYGPAGRSEYGASAVALFREAGLDLAAVDEITALGIYMTNAVKTPKTGYEVGKNAVPAVSTYKLRDSVLFYQGMRLLPSYIMTGRNLQIEKQKLAMAAGDVKKMLAIIGAAPRNI